MKKINRSVKKCLICKFFLFLSERNEIKNVIRTIGKRKIAWGLINDNKIKLIEIKKTYFNVSSKKYFLKKYIKIQKKRKYIDSGIK